MYSCACRSASAHRLHEIVFARARHEPVAFCLVNHGEIGGTTVLPVRHVVTLDDGDYRLGPDTAPPGAARRCCR